MTTLILNAFEIACATGLSVIDTELSEKVVESIGVDNPGFRISVVVNVDGMGNTCIEGESETGLMSVEPAVTKSSEAFEKELLSLGALVVTKVVEIIVVVAVPGKHPLFPATVKKPGPQDGEQEALPAAEKFPAPHGIQELLSN